MIEPVLGFERQVPGRREMLFSQLLYLNFVDAARAAHGRRRVARRTY
jgi:hypothetical protein